MLLNMVDKTKDQIDLLKGIEHIGVYVGAIVHDGNGNVLLQNGELKRETSVDTGIYVAERSSLEKP